MALPQNPLHGSQSQVGDWGFPFHGLFTLLHQDGHAQDQGVITQDRSTLTTHIIHEGGPVILGYPDWSGRGPGQEPFQDPPNFSWRKFPNTAASRKIIVPGHIYTRDEALENFDKANGIDYQPFAIANNHFIGGFSNIVAFGSRGWIYTDLTGGRWKIIPNVQTFAPDWIIWEFTAVPYGAMVSPNSFYGIRNVPDPPVELEGSWTFRTEGPSGLPSPEGIVTGLGLNLFDITNDGSKALYSIGGPPADRSLYENWNPNDLDSVSNQRKAVVKADAQRNSSGPRVVWEAQLSGTPGVDFDVTIVTARSQATCGGTVNTKKFDETLVKQYWSGTYFVDCSTSGTPFSRPGLVSGCVLPQFAVQDAAWGHLSLLNPATTGPIAASCGWERILNDDTDVISSPTNEFPDFKWWALENQDLLETYPPWAASTEYTVGNRRERNGIIFTATVAHTSNDNKEPGVGNLWNLNWEIEYQDTNHDVQDVNVWAEATSYSPGDVVREGAADYWISTGSFTSFDSAADPAQENFDQPNTGSNFAAFWDGPFNILLNPVWVVGKVVIPGWIIGSTYVEPAFPTDNEIELAAWECIKSHVTADDNKPGIGDNWPQYWQKAPKFTTSFGEWDPPVKYVIGDKVRAVGQGKSETEIWEAQISHDSSAATIPNAGSEWALAADPNCFRSEIGALEPALNETSYHINNYRHLTDDIDMSVTGICAGVMYKDDNTVRVFEVDVSYTRTRDTGVIDHVGGFSGSTTRVGGVCNEALTYKFRADGNVKHTITITADATATGSDDWTEDQDTYPITWNASGTRTLLVKMNGVELVNINETITQADTAFGGATGDDILATDKGSWASNDFVNGRTWEFIDSPYLEVYKTRFQGEADLDFPMSGLISIPGGIVGLGAISAVDQYVNPHPTRTQEQIDRGKPLPSIITLWYSDKLIGPFVYGRKTNSGIALDSQYLNVLRPDDMPWEQYGIWGPEAALENKVTLTHGSPVNSIFNWLLDADYGDDIACAYDPITKTIHRNSQYRVVYV
jgi:hypothetical protein